MSQYVRILTLQNELFGDHRRWRWMEESIRFVHIRSRWPLIRHVMLLTRLLIPNIGEISVFGERGNRWRFPRRRLKSRIP